MLSRLACLSILTILVCAAGADRVGASEPIRQESMPAVESADVFADDASSLDLSFEPPLPAERRSRPVVRRARPAPQEHALDKPFSLGFNIKTRPEIGDEARQSTSEPATLTDEVEGVVKRSTFGLTGTYRF